MFNLSECGETGSIVDKRKLSVEDAGIYLEFIAERIASGKPLPFIVAVEFAQILYDAAQSAKQGKGKQAISVIAEGTGLKVPHKRKKVPFWECVSRIEALITDGYSQTNAINVTCGEFHIGKSTADDYWAEYEELMSKRKRQESEICQLVENEFIKGKL